MSEEITKVREDLNTLKIEYKSDRKAMIWSMSVLSLALLAFFGFTYQKIGTLVDDNLMGEAKARANKAIIQIEKNQKEADQLLLQIRKELGEKNISRRRSVLTFTHPDNGYKKGEEWAKRYYHIKTPVKLKSTEMWRYDLTGYSYGEGKPISLTWVGYTFSVPPDIRQGNATDNTGSGVPVSQYFGRDDYLYLRFGPISQYYNSFALDYQSGSTGELVEYHDGYEVIITENDIQIK
ncbi:hypothetical protein LZP73_00030 [Shewanella sp. AS16]|uniref:hypothetical protein n=1 Tax=Shewanella sp. AS16 TaxID=2907625 RepID=UPI001F441418|nr:hypothetical protein [Shewanella sp. AS16]MCE9684610.1 hypothetical protein [Shewanella sp. AS16]